jgi:hypothetical protein
MNKSPMFMIFAIVLLTYFNLPSESYMQAKGNFISSLNVKATKLRFYEGGVGQHPVDTRKYNSRFFQSKSRNIYWQVDLEHAKSVKKTHFKIKAVYIRADGTVFVEQELDTYLEPQWTSSHHSYGYGWKEPGNWPAGTYRVDLFIEGHKIASGSFTITDGKAKPKQPGARPIKKKTDIPDDLGEL